MELKNETKYFDELNNLNLDIKIEGGYIDENGQHLMITMTGYLDAYNSENISSALNKTILEIKPKIVVLNLESVNYVASMGVGALLSVFKNCKKEDIQLKFYNVNPKVMEVLSLLGLGNFFNIIDDINNLDSETLFPVVISCPKCFIKLKVPKPGRFICKGCKSEIRINQRGEVE